MITEDYVSFETAKLLKEKGFDEPCYAYWYEDENKLIISHSMYAIQNITNPCFFGPAVPTLQMAMKWLREVHKLGVFPSTYSITNITGSNTTHVYGTAIVNLNTYELMTSDCMARDTYNEACETAIKYCLENLI